MLLVLPIYGTNGKLLDNKFIIIIFITLKVYYVQHGGLQAFIADASDHTKWFTSVYSQCQGPYINFWKVLLGEMYYIIRLTLPVNGLYSTTLL